MKITLTRENFREMSIFFANNPGASDMKLDVNTKFIQPGPGHGESLAKKVMASNIEKYFFADPQRRQGTVTSTHQYGSAPVRIVFQEAPTEEERLRKEAEELLSSLDF